VRELAKEKVFLGDAVRKEAVSLLGLLGAESRKKM
jgi:hypothetical protein